MAKIRLDQHLTKTAGLESREKARAIIMSGVVFIDGKRMDKPGQMIDEGAELEVRGATMPYVSRGGLKLEKALSAFAVNPSGCVCIDCGASTGGFTDCLLQNGASEVYAVDVGYGQLDWKIRNDSRVHVFERTNIRRLTPADIGAKPSLAVMDLSFISLKIVLPAVFELLEETGEVICLIKPQFEAGREHVGKKGVVRDPLVHEMVIEQFVQNANAANFAIAGLDFSPIKGPEGNIEYLAHLQKNKAQTEVFAVKELVEKSHAQS